MHSGCNSDDQTGCNPQKCPRPDNAREMACDTNGCFVLTCESGYEVSNDFSACLERTHETQCDPSKCAKPAHAKEMACDDHGCYVRTCDDNYKISANEQACILKEELCIPSECPKPENAREMACDANGCFVLACSDGYEFSKDRQSCQKAAQTTPPGNNTGDPQDPQNPSQEVCPVDRTVCPTIDENFCCNGREYLCDYEDWCEGQGLDCPDWSWRSNDCATKTVGALGDRPSTGWCDTINSYSGCVLNLEDEPCTADNIGHIVYDTRCDSVYNNTTVMTCQKLDNGKYAYVGKGYATSFCKEGEPDVMIQCNNKKNRTEEAPCNACKDVFNVYTYHAECQ